VARGDSVEEVIRAVADGYGNGPEDVRGDVEAFVSALVKRGFLIKVQPE
jgi:hypothetical protein